MLEQALAHRPAGDDEAAERALRRCLELGDAPTEYAAVIGAGTFLAATELAHLLLLRGETAEAAELLERTAAEHPRHEPAQRLLAFARAATGADTTSPLPASALSLLAAALDARLAADGHRRLRRPARRSPSASRASDRASAASCSPACTSTAASSTRPPTSGPRPARSTARTPPR